LAKHSTQSPVVLFRYLPSPQAENQNFCPSLGESFANGIKLVAA